MMNEQRATLVQLAEEAAGWFEARKRKRLDGQEFTACKEGAPEWVRDLVHVVHGDELPDDTIYRFISDALDCYSEQDDDSDEDDLRDAIAEMEPDVYTGALTGWLHAHNGHVGYLTAALEEWGGGIRDGFQLLQLAQKAQIEEVATAVLDELVNRAEERPYKGGAR